MRQSVDISECVCVCLFFSVTIVHGTIARDVTGSKGKKSSRVGRGWGNLSETDIRTQ